MNVREATERVLKEAGQPLTIDEITSRVLASNLWTSTGRTPSASIESALATDIKHHGAASAFIRTAPRTYGLNPQPVPKPVPQHRRRPPQLADQRGVLTFLDAAEKVLKEDAGRMPMHYRDVTVRATSRGLIASQGQTPEATMYSQILTDMQRRARRGDPPRFIRHGPGLFGLQAWEHAGLTSQIEQHNGQVRQKLHAHIRAIPPAEFEQLVGRLLGALGFEAVQVTKLSGDGGIDARGTLVVGDAVRIQMAVQAKRWQARVQKPVVHAVRGALGVHEQGLIITTSDFSAGARREATDPTKTPVALMNGEQLVKLLIEHDILVARTSYDLLELEAGPALSS